MDSETVRRLADALLSGEADPRTVADAAGGDDAVSRALARWEAAPGDLRRAGQLAVQSVGELAHVDGACAGSDQLRPRQEGVVERVQLAGAEHRPTPGEPPVAGDRGPLERHAVPAALAPRRHGWRPGTSRGHLAALLVDSVLADPGREDAVVQRQQPGAGPAAAVTDAEAGPHCRLLTAVEIAFSRFATLALE